MKIDMQLPQISDICDVLPVNGQHGLCRAYYQPDELDIKAIEYATQVAQSEKNLFALDLGSSPYFPQSQRLAKVGFYVDAFDLEKPFANFDEINKVYQNRIHYQTRNITELKSTDLRNDYQIIYSNRCLSFISYHQAYTLIRMLLSHIKTKTRYFLGFFAESAKYADNYPMDLALESRFVPLDNSIAKGNQMLAPVCVYTRDEIFENLLGGLPITITEVLQATSGSIKVIFENKCQ